jgi:hypothetical protein
MKRAYATAAGTPSADFAGANTIRATPMIAKTADPISSLREIMSSSAWKDITVACARLDHAVKGDQAAVR